MRALTLKQPWLFTITDLDKWVENRSWKIPDKLQGEWIALHAGQANESAEWRKAGAIHGALITSDVVFGAITAVCTFTHIVTRAMQITAYKRKWFFGPYGWVIGEKYVLDAPIPCRGMLGLWTVPEEIAADISRQLVVDGIIEAATE